MRPHDKLFEAQRTRKSNKDFLYTALDIWDRLHISLEYSLNNNAVLDTMIEDLVAAIHKNSDDITQKVLRKLIEQACEACDVTPFGSSRLVWYRDGNSIHTAHHDPTGGQVQSTVTLIANQRDVLA